MKFVTRSYKHLGIAITLGVGLSLVQIGFPETISDSITFCFQSTLYLGIGFMVGSLIRRWNY